MDFFRGWRRRSPFHDAERDKQKYDDDNKNNNFDLKSVIDESQKVQSDKSQGLISQREVGSPDQDDRTTWANKVPHYLFFLFIFIHCFFFHFGVKPAPQILRL